MYSMNEQLAKEQKHNVALDEYFSKWFQIFPVNRDIERLGIDRIFQAKTSGQRYSIQYKSDDTAGRTNKVFIETVSVDTENKPGWAYTTTAQILVYYIPAISTAFRMTMLTFRECLTRWERQYGDNLKTIENDGYNTIGFPVPIPDFAHFACKIDLVNSNGR